MLAGKGSVESVGQQGVIELPISQAISPATAPHEVRRLIHILHPAGDGDVGVAEQDLLRRRHEGLRPRAADAVYRHGQNRPRPPRMKRPLARRSHLRPPLNPLAHSPPPPPPPTAPRAVTTCA